MRVSCILLLVLLGAAEAIVVKPTLLNTEKLLKEAISVDQQNEPSPTSRALEFQDDYSIQFTQCLSLKMEADDDMFTQQTRNLTESGHLLKQKSYVLFNVCQTESCGTRYDSGNHIYMTSLENYMKALIPASKVPDIDSLCKVCNTYCL